MYNDKYVIPKDCDKIARTVPSSEVCLACLNFISVKKDFQVQHTWPAIYVDVSEWLQSKSSTGIQRVLREAITGLQRTERAVRVIPVVAYNGKFHELNENEYKSLTDIFESSGSQLKAVSRESLWRAIKYRIKQIKPIAFLLINLYTALVAIRKKNNGITRASVSSLPISVAEQDVLLLMDAFWPPYLDIESATRWVTYNRGKVLLLVHDLIPMLRPSRLDLVGKFIFKKRLMSLTALSSKNMVVSYDQLSKIKKHLPNVDYQKFKVIHLGADGPKHGEKACGPSESGVKREPNVILMVGSLAERKGHNVVLQAFDELYTSGHRHLQLVVAGDELPATGKIKKIIDGSAPMPPYLKLLGKVSDKTLADLYAQASACIFASNDEGFGIPLWEAQHFQTPVIASDIPIFRELGNQNVTYFECDNSRQLANILRLHTYRFTEVELRTWAHFSADLLNIVDSLFPHHPSIPESTAGNERKKPATLKIGEVPVLKLQ